MKVRANSKRQARLSLSFRIGQELDASADALGRSLVDAMEGYNAAVSAAVDDLAKCIQRDMVELMASLPSNKSNVAHCTEE